jgi:hypothetical protein
MGGNSREVNLRGLDAARKKVEPLAKFAGGSV